MARIAASDYRKVLDVLYAAGAVAGSLAFPKPVLDSLRSLVPCDVVAFHERSTEPDRVIVYAGEPLGEMTPEIRAAHRRLRHEDPVRPVAGARTFSDVLSLREFRQSELYRSVQRPLGIEHMLWVYLDPQRTDARFEFDRGRSDFTARDRRVLDVLVPHLCQLHRAARRRDRGSCVASELTQREREVITLVAEGRTNGEIGALLGISTETVRKHLENVYDKLGVHTRTGAVAAAYGRAAAPGQTAPARPG